MLIKPYKYGYNERLNYERFSSVYLRAIFMYLSMDLNLFQDNKLLSWNNKTMKILKSLKPNEIPLDDKRSVYLLHTIRRWNIVFYMIF